MYSKTLDFPFLFTKSFNLNFSFKLSLQAKPDCKIYSIFQVNIFLFDTIKLLIILVDGVCLVVDVCG